jgi:hypothetical protein
MHTDIVEPAPLPFFARIARIDCPTRRVSDGGQARPLRAAGNKAS